MNWHPTDLVSDLDLRSYERTILEAFNTTDWADKRTKALEDWLAPILRTQGFPIHRLRTRFEPDGVLGYTGSTFADLTSAATNADADDLDLAAIFATPASDYMYVGSTQPFRGVSIRMLDAVSSVAGTLAAHFWADGWTGLAVTDETIKVSGKSLSGGGSVTWTVPSTWVPRKLDTSDPLYWVRLAVSAVPIGAAASQIGVIRRSALCAAVTFRTLTLIMREAPSGGGGPWAEKAAWYETEADAALQRALQTIGGEFDTDESDQVSAEEAAQTVAEVGGGFKWERG